MRRRKLLRLGAAALPALGGCTGPPRGGATPAGTDGGRSATPVADPESYAWNRAPDAAVADAPYPQGAVGPYYVSAVRTPTEAAAFREAFLGSDPEEGAAAFLDGTAFDAGSLLAVQDAAGSSHPDLAATRADPVGGGVHLRAEYPGEGATADTVTDSLLVRVPGDPAFARATVRPRSGDPVTFATATARTAPRLSPPRPLAVRNRDCAGHRVRIRGRIDGDLVALGTVEVAPGSVDVRDAVFEYGATYGVDAAVAESGATAETELTFDRERPGGALVDIDGAGAPSIRAVEAVPTPDGAGCRSGSRPYESGDPADNLDDPVDLWVVSRDSDPRTLTVTIRDGDIRAFRRRFDLAGGDKAREANLLAGKGRYGVRADPEGGTAVERTVRVEAGVSTLTVFVAGDGSITVAVD